MAEAEASATVEEGLDKLHIEESAPVEPPAVAAPVKVVLYKKRITKKGGAFALFCPLRGGSTHACVADKLNFPRKGATVKVTYEGRFAGTEPGVEGAIFGA
jgi:hypothetical protein